MRITRMDFFKHIVISLIVVCAIHSCIYSQDKQVFDVYYSIADKRDPSIWEKEQIWDSLVSVHSGQHDPTLLGELYYSFIRGFGKRHLDKTILYSEKMKSLGEERGLELEFLFKKNHNNLALFYSWNKDPYEVIALSEEYFRKFNQEDALLSKLYRLSGVAYR